jgi:hypothetical protein
MSNSGLGSKKDNRGFSVNLSLQYSSFINRFIIRWLTGLSPKTKENYPSFFEDKWRAFKESMESTGTNSDSKVHDRLKVASSFFTRNGLPLALKKGILCLFFICQPTLWLNSLGTT